MLNDELKTALNSSFIISRESFDAELARETFGAPVHDHVVVPLEDGPRDGREQVHPGLRRAHVPVVAHARRVALFGEVPAARPRKLADGLALYERQRLDARQRHVEGEPVWKLAAPRVASHGADALGVARLDLLDALDAAPPIGPLLRAVDQLPHARERRAEPPERDEAVVGHASYYAHARGRGFRRARR